MNKTIIHTSCLFIAMILTAFAGTDTKDMKDMKGIVAPEPSDAGLYVAMFGGANVAQGYHNSQTEVSTPLLPGGGATFNGGHSTNYVGGVGGLKVGYNFNSFALCDHLRLQPAVEVEGFYVGTKTGISYNPNVGGVPFHATLTGEQNNAVFSVNGLLRLKTDTCFTPYIGGGVGAEYLNFSSSHASFSNPAFGSGLSQRNADDVTLALQAIAGFDIEIAKHWSIFTEYKYLVSVDPSLGLNGNIAGIPINTTFEPDFIGQHLVTAGLKYNF